MPRESRFHKSRPNMACINDTRRRLAHHGRRGPSEILHRYTDTMARCHWRRIPESGRACRSAGAVLRSPDDVIYRDAQSIGQLAQGVNRPGASTCLDLHNLHPIDAGRAGKIRLGQVSQLAPHPQRRLFIDETVNDVGWDQLFLASKPRDVVGLRRRVCRIGPDLVTDAYPRRWSPVNKDL